MSEVKWVKISTNLFNDEKIMIIQSMKQGDEMVLIWIRLLCLAGKSNSGGYLMISEETPYTVNMLCSVLSKSKKTVEAALELFRQLNMIDTIDGRIYILNWEKHQNMEKMEKIREQSKNRMRTLREQQRNKSVTESECYATDIDIDIELDKEKEKNKRKRNTLSDSGNPSEPVLIFLPLNDKSEYPIFQTDADAWKELYPSVDIQQQLRNMRGWLDANPTRRKTKQGIKRFINAWLSKEQNRSKSQNTSYTLSSGAETSNPFVAMMEEFEH